MAVQEQETFLTQKFLKTDISILKPHVSHTVSSSQPVQVALELLQEDQNGSLVCIKPDGKAGGIFTEHDAVQKVALKNFNLIETPVREVMTPSPHAVQHNASIARALNVMAKLNCRHVLVLHPKEDIPLELSSIDFIVYIHDHLSSNTDESSGVTITNPTTVEKFFECPLSDLAPEESPRVSADTSVRTVLRRMCSADVQSVAVTGENEELIGLFTDRDYMLRVALRDIDLAETPVSEVMSHSPVVALEDTPIREAFKMMAQGAFRHIPVVDQDKRLIKTLSIKHIVKYLSRSIVHELSDYDSK